MTAYAGDHIIVEVQIAFSLLRLNIQSIHDDDADDINDDADGPQVA